MVHNGEGTGLQLAGFRTTEYEIFNNFLAARPSSRAFVARSCIGRYYGTQMLYTVQTIYIEFDGDHVIDADIVAVLEASIVLKPLAILLESMTFACAIIAKYKPATKMPAW
jgi:hypothetical protein